jgi:Uma2 family endonuclease
MANEPQPDALLRILPDYGGHSTIDAQDYITGGPELVVAVSASTVRHDLGPKFAAYLRNGVQEYLVWKVQESKVDWFALRRDHYELLTPSPEGWLRSDVFPGLWLDAAALIRGDLATLHQVLQKGLTSPEHAAFVDQLRRHATGNP